MVSYSDFIYYFSLLGCISLGRYYKDIQNPGTKRSCGTGLGILVIWMVCGKFVKHAFLMVWGNIVIIKCCKKSYIHHLSLAYTWLYLIYMHLNIGISNSYANYVLWIHQAIALRLVGLAFEITLAEKSKRPAMGSLSTMPTLHDKLNGELTSEQLEPSVLDVISYAFFFIGLHKGPYYRWKTFNEHFNIPFGMLGNWRIVTQQKLKKALAFGLLYVVLNVSFPDEVYYENGFYHYHGTDYRYLYNIPQLLTYVLEYQVLMMLCTSVCTEAGFGVYPAKTQPVPGHGPSTGWSLLQMSAVTDEVALGHEYNFAMIRTFENEKLLMGPRLSDTLKGWDMSTRYWFWTFPYKNMIRANNDVRSALSFLAWGVWCGLTIQKLIICSTMWVHVRLEHEYSETYSAHVESMKTPWDIGFSIMRVFCLIYLTPCLVLDDYTVVLRYYNSIYWVYHIILLLLILGAVALQKNQMMVITNPVAAL